MLYLNEQPVSEREANIVLRRRRIKPTGCRECDARQQFFNDPTALCNDCFYASQRSVNYGTRCYSSK